MAATQWIPGHPSGVWRNRALSSNLRMAAIAETKGLQFVRAEPGFGRNMGDTITIPRVPNLTVPTTGVIGRNQKVPVDSLTLAQTTITLTKYGRGVEFDEESEVLDKFDPKDYLQKTLIKQMKLVLDAVVFTAFKACQLRVAPTSSTTYTLTTDAGTTPATATNNVSVSIIKQIRDLFAATYLVDPYEGDDWMALSSTKALRGVKDDPEFLAWRQYIQPESAFYRGEAGMIEHVRMVEVVNTSALSGSKGTGSVLGEMVIFGDDPVVMIEAITPELRMGIPSNFGLQKAVAWIGMLGFGEVWPTSTAGQARILYMTSS